MTDVFKTIQVKVYPGKPDIENGPFITTTGDVIRRSLVFGPLLANDEMEQDLYLGNPKFVVGDLEIIFKFYTLCHLAGKTDDTPPPEQYNPRDSESVALFAIPEDALAMLSSLRTKGSDGEDCMDLDRLTNLATVADFMGMNLFLEGLAQVIAPNIKDKTPEDIQVMRGRERKWTEEMEKEVIADHPWLA